MVPDSKNSGVTFDQMMGRMFSGQSQDEDRPFYTLHSPIPDAPGYEFKFTMDKPSASKGDPHDITVSIERCGEIVFSYTFTGCMKELTLSPKIEVDQWLECQRLLEKVTGLEDMGSLAALVICSVERVLIHYCDWRVGRRDISELEGVQAVFGSVLAWHSDFIAGMAASCVMWDIRYKLEHDQGNMLGDLLRRSVGIRGEAYRVTERMFQARMVLHTLFTVRKSHPELWRSFGKKVRAFFKMKHGIVGDLTPEQEESMHSVLHSNDPDLVSKAFSCDGESYEGEWDELRSDWWPSKGVPD